MTEVILEPTEVVQVDTQFVQTSQIGSAQPATLNQTQQTSTHAERSGRSGERHRIPRSSSSSGSRGAASGEGYTASSRGEGPIGTGSYQQYAAESSYAYGGVTSAVSGGSPVTPVVGERRAGRHRKEVIRLPDQAQAQVRQVRRRVPTPEPDTLERV
jgi:hypothetical protein